MNDRIADMRALASEHAPSPIVGLSFATLICDGCGAQAFVRSGDPPGWKIGKGGPPDLCAACVAGAGTLHHRLLVALRVAERRKRGFERELRWYRL